MIFYVQVLLLTLCTCVLTISSLWLLIGLLGQISLCHAAISAVGAYASAICSMALIRFSHKASSSCALAFLCVLIGALAGGIAGFLSGLPAAKLKKEHITLSTLAFGEILKSIIINTPYLGGEGFLHGSAGQSLIGIPPIVGTVFTLCITILCLLFLAYIKKSPFGRACRAVRDDEAAARSIGLHPARIKILAFCLSGVVAGISGCLFAHGIGTLAPGSFSYVKSTEYVMFCVPTGDSLLLSVFSGAICAFLPALLSPLGKHRMLFYSLGILIFILYKAKKGHPHEKQNRSSCTKLKRQFWRCASSQKRFFFRFSK